MTNRILRALDAALAVILTLIVYTLIGSAVIAVLYDVFTLGGYVTW